MKTLSPSDFGRVKPLVESSPNQGCVSFVYSVLDGRTPGQIIVDTAHAPRVALITAKNTAYLFLEPAVTHFKAINPFLMDYLQSEIPDEGVTLWATSPEQVAVLQALFSLETRRITFSFPTVNAPHNEPHRDGYRLETFVETSELGETTCFGARLFHAEMMVSACYSDLFAGGEAEIQIRTHPEYRRKGLASEVARRFMEQARAHHLRPAWSCDEDNAASCAFATRLGFVRTTPLHGYYLHPAFLTWRQNASAKIGPSPEADTDGFEDEAAVRAADAVVQCLLEAGTIQEPCPQMLVVPRTDGLEARLIEVASSDLVQTFPLALRAALTAQLKFRAGMHIDRQGFPQRGRFAAAWGTTERIIHLVVTPSEYGEKMLLSVA